MQFKKQPGLHKWLHSRCSLVWEFPRKPAWAAERVPPTPSTPREILVKTSLGCRKGFAHAEHTFGNFCKKPAWAAEPATPALTTALGIQEKTSLGCRKGFAHTNDSSGNSCKKPVWTAGFAHTNHSFGNSYGNQSGLHRKRIPHITPDWCLQLAQIDVVWLYCGNRECFNLGQKQPGLRKRIHSPYSQVWEFL